MAIHHDVDFDIAERELRLRPLSRAPFLYCGSRSGDNAPLNFRLVLGLRKAIRAENVDASVRGAWRGDFSHFLIRILADVHVSALFLDE